MIQNRTECSVKYAIIVSPSIVFVHGFENICSIFSTFLSCPDSCHSSLKKYESTDPHMKQRLCHHPFLLYRSGNPWKANAFRKRESHKQSKAPYTMPCCHTVKEGAFLLPTLLSPIFPLHVPTDYRTLPPRTVQNPVPVSRQVQSRFHEYYYL